MKKLFAFAVAAIIAATMFSPAHAQSVAGCYRDGSGGGGALNCLPAIQASKSAAISVSTSGTIEIIAAIPATAIAEARAIYLTSFNFMSAGTVNATLVYGTGTNCGTGQVALTGTYPLVAQAGVSSGNGMGLVLFIPKGNALCITISGSIQVSGSVSYVQF